MKAEWTINRWAAAVAVIVAVAFMVVSPARGAILVYEPFDYAVSSPLSGKSGLTEVGFTGTWLHDWTKDGYVYAAGYNGLDAPNWDGVVNNVPTAPATVKFAASAPADGEMRMRRVLSSNVGAMAGADNILWLGAVCHYENRVGGSGLFIGLGSGYVIDRGRTIKAGPNGLVFMGSSAPDNGDKSLYASIETNNAAAAWQKFPTGSLPPISEDCIVVLKYTFGDGTASTVDTVEGVVFSENDTLSEAAFNSHPGKVSASFDSSVLNESTFNLLSFTQGQEENAIDEIRIGDTFDDVIGLAAGPVDADLSGVVAVPGSVNADGLMPAAITVKLRDAFWLPVTNHTVSLSGSTGNATITAVSATTGANGEAAFQVTSSTAETEVFTATDTTASVVITQTASVEFVAVDQTAPPTPTFVTPLGPVTYHSITVVANPVTDPEGKDVEYRFNNVTLGTDSGWLSSPSNTFVGLSPETSYSFTVEARDTALTPNVSAPSGAQSATTLVRPSSTWALTDSTANVLVWLDASDTGTLTTNASGQVSQWADKSGHDNHQLQANTSYQPVSGTRTLNGLNTVDFDGANDTMQEAVNAFGSVISNAALFIVSWSDAATDMLHLDPTLNRFKYGFRYGDRLSCTVNGSVNWDGYCEFYNPDATNLLGRVGMHEVFYSVSEDLFKLSVDGNKTLKKGSTDVYSMSANGTVATAAGIQLAAGFNGLFAEIVIIDGTITTEERQKIEGYLAWKWGSELRLPADHPYYSAPPAGPPPAGTIMYIR